MSFNSVQRDDLTKALDEIVGSGFLGAQVRVRDGRDEWVGSAGVSELGGTAEPPTDGHFRIGSATKTFVAAVALGLVADGALGLDRPVADHLPGFGLDGRITLRMLLRHTSGVFNFTGELYEDGTVVLGIPAAGVAGKEWVDLRFHSYPPEELVRLALSKPGRFEPGTGWSYSNTNYLLARLLVERVTGRPFAAELRDRITGPLGLPGTVAPGASAELPEPHAHSYYRYDDTTVDVTRHNPSWDAGGGDLISTTADLATFLSALLGGRVLPAPLLAEMRTPEPVAGYGLGMFVQDAGPKGTLFHHHGGMAGYATLMCGSPDGSRVLTASLTCVDDAGMSIAPAFRQAQQRLVDEVFPG